VTGVVLVAENLRDTGLAVGVLYRRLTGEGAVRERVDELGGTLRAALMVMEET
jgi:hypothetical protein